MWSESLITATGFSGTIMKIVALAIARLPSITTWWKLFLPPTETICVAFLTAFERNKAQVNTAANRR